MVIVLSKVVNNTTDREGVVGAETYRSKATTLHVLDLWLAPEAALAGKVKVSRAPMTYVSRLALKRRLRRTGNFATMRGRGGGRVGH